MSVATLSILGSNRTYGGHTPADKIREKIGTGLETSPSKCLAQLTEQTGVSASSPRFAVKLLFLRLRL